MTENEARNLFRLETNFSQSELKKLYRERAKIAHPDMGGSDLEFQELQTAYDRSMDKEWSYPCKKCDGDGTISVPFGHRKWYIKCQVCEGKGEIKMWNPVISRGYLKSKSSEAI